MFIFHLMYHIKNIEATRPRYMRTRPMLHEAEAEAKTYEAEAEATKFGLETLTSLCITHAGHSIVFALCDPVTLIF